ncbi:hypothetical protein EON67_02390 [archaeon]|nr:MAG: hypothetical protein EON67_02390 [archaeon]
MRVSLRAPHGERHVRVHPPAPRPKRGHNPPPTCCTACCTVLVSPSTHTRARVCAARPALLRDALVACARCRPDIMPVVRARSAGTKPILPYCAMLLDNVVGYVFSTHIHDTMSVTLRSISIALAVVYIGIMIMLAPTADARRSAVATAVTALLLAISIPVSVYRLLTDADAQQSALGAVNTLTAIMFAAAPLASIRTVLATRDASSLPFTTISMLTVCAASWAVYGVILRNVWIVAPNVMNAILAGVQLALCLLFPGPKRAAASDAGTARTKLE